MKGVNAYGVIVVMFFSCLLFIGGINSLPPLVSIQSQALTGKDLAMRYCQMCHKFPDPYLLDKSTWTKSVLPNMGMRLGIRNNGDTPFKGMDLTTASVARYLNIYPDSSMVSMEDWLKIVDYYKKNAPRKLPKQEKPFQKGKGNFPFDAKYMKIGDNALPQITLLKFDPKTSELFVGDYLNLYVINNKGEIRKSWRLTSPASHIEFEETTFPLLLTIGKLGPSDQRLGTLYRLGRGADTNSIEVAFENLGRPVNFATADLNMDDKEDIVICNFGNYGGKLSWYDDFNLSKEHILKNLPGATRVEIRDLNGDDMPDIIALMAQAYEQIIIFYNKGNGEFEENPVLQFNPVHGTSYFEMADFNEDGFEDLLVTNGDNRDNSPIDKPYHGIRIYLNDGKNNFEESFFYPMYDCSKAMARDFDKDGDLDIVAISFYNGYNNLKDPKESFVYLSNMGGENFTSSFTSEKIHGKWLTMEVGDFNQDSLLDVVLGSCIINLAELSNVMDATEIYSFPQLLFFTQIR